MNLRGTTLAILGLAAAARGPQDAEDPLLLGELKACPYRIVFETRRDGNWELYLMNAGGSNPVNLTRTLDVDELYPKASPDGSRICFVADEDPPRPGPSISTS